MTRKADLLLSFLKKTNTKQQFNLEWPFIKQMEEGMEKNNLLLQFIQNHGIQFDSNFWLPCSL